ncbi:hypothetical protein HY632_01245 [Candidatus Uhrbacteria bacterium]|nr:hypothetical protein [Candidatus Uhrbacteria bacterium]
MMVTMRFQFNVSSGALALTTDTGRPGQEEGRIREVVDQCRRGHYMHVDELRSFSRRVPNVHPLSFFGVTDDEFAQWEQEAKRVSVAP